MNEATERAVRSLLATASDGGPERVEFEAPARRRRVLVPVLAALAAALAAVITMTSTTGSALAVVTAAAERTAGDSFRVTGSSVSPEKSMTSTGYFDPAARTGRTVVEGTGRETRFIGDQVYQYDGVRWTVEPRVDDPPVFKLAYMDPQAALAQLQAASQVKEEGAAPGDGWTGTRYSFEIDLPDLKGDRHVTGIVDIDEQGRVRHMEMQVGDSRNVADYFDFGAREEVAAPPDAQPAPDGKRSTRP
ncbi:hypothetical protein [Nonomuraea soli]|uniref:Outer membrane lipoprotein carrier protein LolA n=1 Tax=Nonomuraea soli TaxID=1032476 RepID=A0A7W0HRC7_9ACTN|nr:hypothetical protein [Nonomuraea soli]MBA2892869.1 hypothetical protein [Nonomuraea soli]